MSEWADCQREAIQRAYSLLGEHFEKVVIIVSAPPSDSPEDDGEEMTETWYKGGFTTAIGLLDYSKHRLLHKNDRVQAEAEEEDGEDSSI